MDLRQILFIVVFMTGLILQGVYLYLMKKRSDIKYWSVCMGINLATILSCVANFLSCFCIRAEDVVAERALLSMIVAIIAGVIELVIVSIAIVLKETNEKTAQIKGKKEILLIVGFLTLMTYLIVFLIIPTIQYVFTNT